jgi:hypothetical protein
MDQPVENTQLIGDKLEASAHSSDSSLREQALGHVFLGQLLTFMWQSGARDIEVLKSEVDRGGYDVVLESNGIIRHVQLKSSFRGSKVREVDVSTKLLRKPGGCILWLEFDPESLAIGSYYWFGGKAGTALPDLGARVSRHSKGNSEGEKNERPIHRVLSRGRFEALADINEVVERLFGYPPAASSAQGDQGCRRNRPGRHNAGGGAAIPARPGSLCRPRRHPVGHPAN